MTLRLSEASLPDPETEGFGQPETEHPERRAHTAVSRIEHEIIPGALGCGFIKINVVSPLSSET